MLVGYDDRRQALRAINSWGEDWGDHGYIWISYNLVGVRFDETAVFDVVMPKKPVAFSGPQPEPVRVPVQVVVPAPPKPLPPRPVPPPPKIVTQPVVAPPPMPAPPPPAPPVAQATFSELQSLQCAGVKVTTQGGRNVLSGFVASDGDLKIVKRIAAAVLNTSLGEVFVAPWPQCEALQTLSSPLAATDRPEISIDPKKEFRAGETLKIEIRSPAQISYIYVAYVQADGTVVNLAQPKGVVPQPTLPGQTLIFGDGEQGRQKFTVDPPFGREMIIALASRSPLFNTDLPTQQTEREYLSELRRALIYKPSSDLPDREIAASVVVLQTHAR